MVKCPECGEELQKFPKHSQLPPLLQCESCHIIIWESYAIELQKKESLLNGRKRI